MKDGKTKSALSVKRVVMKKLKKQKQRKQVPSKPRKKGKGAVVMAPRHQVHMVGGRTFIRD